MNQECKICCFEFKSYRSLSLHIVQTHKISSKNYYDKYLKKKDEGICSECGKETKFSNINSGYVKHCSLKCSNSSSVVKDKKTQSNLKKYGVTHAMKLEKFKDKYKHSFIETYGTDNPSKLEEVLSKKRISSIEKYGFSHPCKSQEIKDKIIQTCLDKYNVDNPMKVRKFKDKLKQTCLKKYGVENPSQREEWRLKMSRSQASYMLSFVKNPSKPQVELYCLVKSLHKDTILNFPSKGKSGKSYSLDVAIPSLKIDIEYDESYWHPDQEKDKIRQEDLEKLGWKFLRYRDYIPTLEELILDIQSLL